MAGTLGRIDAEHLGAPAAPLAWPRIACPAAHGPPRGVALAHLQRVLQGGSRRR